MPLYNSLEGIIIVALMISTGYVLTHKGWFKEETADMFTDLVINISLPLMMFYSLTNTFNKEELLQIGDSLLIPIIGMGTSYLLGIILSRLLKVKRGRRYLFAALFVFSNTIFIGLPVNIALFGLESVPIVSIYYLINTIMFWTFGLYGIRSEIKTEDRTPILQKIFTPALISFLIAIIVIMLEVNVPDVILETCQYIGGLTTPLSLFVMGIILYDLDLSRIKINKEMLAIICGQFIITPLLVIFIFSNFYADYPLLIKKVFTIEAAMPAMVTITMVSRSYNADHEYAAFMVTATTALSIFVIPLYMLFLV